jgi:hypothetical protein
VIVGNAFEGDWCRLVVQEAAREGKLHDVLREGGANRLLFPREI